MRVRIYLATYQPFLGDRSIQHSDKAAKGQVALSLVVAQHVCVLF